MWHLAFGVNLGLLYNPIIIKPDALATS